MRDTPLVTDRKLTLMGRAGVSQTADATCDTGSMQAMATEQTDSGPIDKVTNRELYHMLRSLKLRIDVLDDRLEDADMAVRKQAIRDSKQSAEETLTSVLSKLEAQDRLTDDEIETAGLGQYFDDS